MDHLQSYDFALSQYMGAGCGMTYRGDRLYDQKGDASYNMVKKKVQWFKKYRQILISDIVHIKRPTGQGIDAFLHVNPKLPSHKALAMVFKCGPTPASSTPLPPPARPLPFRAVSAATAAATTTTAAAAAAAATAATAVLLLRQSNIVPALLLCACSPTTEPLTENLTLPLYYSGLTNKAFVSVGGAAATQMTLARDYTLVVPVSLPGKSTTWVLVSK
eukprot:COSAG05_NODE_277_length_12336_cov_419.763668_5_plen_218_part_00